MFSIIIVMKSVHLVVCYFLIDASKKPVTVIQVKSVLGKPECTPWFFLILTDIFLKPHKWYRVISGVEILQVS